jgi:hypothetical protein
VAFGINDTVRVARLLVDERDVTGSAAEPPQPRVGEVGTVVDDVGDGLYLVEQLTADGYTLWLTEFAGEELELVERAEQRDRA